MLEMDADLGYMYSTPRVDCKSRINTYCSISAMMMWLLVIILVSLYALFRINRRHIEKYAELMPGDKAYPIIGNAHRFYGIRSSSDLINILIELVEKFREKNLVRVWMGPLLIVIAWDYKFVELIANHPNSANKSDVYSIVFGDVFKGIVMTNGGPKIKELRKPLMKTLNKKCLEQNYHFSFVQKSNKLVDYIKTHTSGEEINVMYLVGNSFVDIFSETHLGVKTEELKGNKFNYLGHFSSYTALTLLSIFKYNLYIWKLVLLFTETGRKWRSNKKGCSGFHEWVLNERQKMHKEEKDGIELYPDFMLRRGVENKLSSKEIGKELGDVILAGTDTSSVVTSSCLAYLAMFPEIQETVFQEQFSIFGNTSRDATYEDASSMKYLEMVIKETLRHVSPPGIFKECTGDVQLGEYKVPKGAILFIIIQELHKDPKFWEKPSSFYPEHFLPEKEASRPYHTYIPFGCGPRACPGAAYGINATKMIVSTVVRNFKMTTTLKFDQIKYDYNLLRLILPGYFIKFEQRIYEAV